MSHGHKFNPQHAARLNNPQRLEVFRPEALWNALGVENASVLVDLGAGTGLLTREFARLAPDATVYAVDVSAEMLDFLGEHTPDDLADRLVPVLATESAVPLGDAIADAVTMIALHHELDDRAATLRDVLRLLRPGGRLLVVDWVAGPTETGPPIEQRVSAEQIVRDLEEAGFELPRSLSILEDFSVIVAEKPAPR